MYMLKYQPFIWYYQCMQIFQSFTPEVVEMLKNGGIGVIPTDTVYGIVAPLLNQAAVERIYDAKGRDSQKPVGTILIADSEQIEEYVEPGYLLAAEVYWPGPVSVILELGTRFSYAHRGKQSLPFRVPDNTSLQNLLKQTGPLASTSANLAGQPPATTMQDALSTFRANVDFYVEGGDLSGNKPSKIIEIVDSTVNVIREG